MNTAVERATPATETGFEHADGLELLPAAAVYDAVGSTVGGLQSVIGTEALSASSWLLLLALTPLLLLADEARKALARRRHRSRR